MNRDRRLRRRADCGAALLLPVLALTLLSVPLAGRATAAGPLLTGWWSTAPAQAVPVTATDVPEGGLLVQGGTSVDAPTAFAAMSFDLPDDVLATALVVVISATTPGAALQACPLTSAFAPAAGGPMSDAPGVSCTDPVPAVLSDDGTRLSFAVASLVEDGVLSVALMPTTTTDRVVLTKPDVNTLATTSTTIPPGSAPVPAPAEAASGPGTATGSDFVPFAVEQPSTGLAPLAAFMPPIAVPSGIAPSSATAEGPTVAPDTAVTDVPQALSPAASSASTPVGGSKGWLAALVVLATAVLWGAASRSAGRLPPDSAQVSECP